MDQVMLLDGAPTEADVARARAATATGASPNVPAVPSALSIVGGILAAVSAGVLAHSVYRSYVPYREERPRAKARRRQSASALGAHDNGEITLFYQDGCQHCQRMRQSLRTARRKGHLAGFQIFEEDASTSEEADRRGVDTVPTLLVRRGKSEKLYKAPALTKKLNGDWSPEHVAKIAAGK